jgi:formylglycine-generating enzyme required for sulfatase activity
VNVYAVSIPGVTPSRNLTWFQAAAAARNAGKRLPSNAEWQAAALGTPDGFPCNVGGSDAVPTGTVGCVSDVGAFDMVGNLYEFVADWVPLSTGCGAALFGTGDSNCLAGAGVGGPGVVLRGGTFIGRNFVGGPFAGVFDVNGLAFAGAAFPEVGFRAAR